MHENAIAFQKYLIKQIGTNTAMFIDHFDTLVMVTVSLYNQP